MCCAAKYASGTLFEKHPDEISSRKFRGEGLLKGHEGREWAIERLVTAVGLY